MGESLTSRAFKQLYVELVSFIGEKDSRIVQFTGPVPRTGTSFVARSFALVAAAMEHRPALLMDLNKAQNHQLSRFLRMVVNHPEALPTPLDAPVLPARGPWLQHRAPDGRVGSTLHLHWFSQFNLAVSECRDADGPPTLDIDGQAKFWQAMRQHFGLIVVDCSPRSEGIECLAVAPHADATVVVISAEETRVPVAQTMRDELIEAEARIAGVVFNKRRFYIPEFIYKRLGA